MKEIKPILIIALCLFASVFGLYMQFFAKDKNLPDGAQKEAVMAEKEVPAEENEVVEVPNGMYTGLTEEELAAKDWQPVPEEELEAETYGDGKLNAYFTEMEEIQEDDTFLPYQGYADLASETVEFLKQQTEVELPEEKYIELKLSPGMTYKRNNLISFHCYFAEIDTDLEIEYVYDDSLMEYIDIHFVKKGEWNLRWKK